MPYLMIGDNLSLFLAEHAVFLLHSHQNDLYRLQQILLGNRSPVMFNRQNCGFIHHVGKIRSDCTGGGQGDLVKINRLVQPYLLCVNLQNIDASLQIRTIHNDPAVKTSRPQKRGIQNLRAVRCPQNQKSLGTVKAIHFRQKLVQRLFSLVVSSVMGIPGLSDRINLINKNDTGSSLFGFVEKIPDTGRADADKHFYKLRPGEGEKGHMRLPGDSLRQKRLPCSGRADQKRSLRKFCADLYVLRRIMKKIHAFLQRFLGLLFSGHIRKGYSGVLLHIVSCLAPADSHHAAAFVHIAHDDIPSDQKDDQRKHDTKNSGCNRSSHIRRFFGIFDPSPLQDVIQSVFISHQCGGISQCHAGLIRILRGYDKLLILKLDL